MNILSQQINIIKPEKPREKRDVRLNYYALF